MIPARSRPLLDAEFTVFDGNAGYDEKTKNDVRPTSEKLVFLHTEVKL